VKALLMVSILPRLHKRVQSANSSRQGLSPSADNRHRTVISRKNENMPLTASQFKWRRHEGEPRCLK
jgi:hypothetical protein